MCNSTHRDLLNEPFEPGGIFVMDGRREMGIGLNERSWHGDVHFSSIGQFRPPQIWPKCPETVFFSKHELFQGVSLQRMIVETWELPQMKSLCV